MTGLGELDGVADEVGEDLPDPSGVAPQPRGHVRVHAGEQQQRFLPGHGRVGGDGILDQLPGAESFGLQHHLSGLDAGDIEDVADELEQDVRGMLDGHQMAPLLRGQRREFQQFQRPQHAIQRRADFMAHGRKEGGLRGAGLIGVALGLGQPPLDFRMGADVGEGAQDHVAMAIARRRVGDVQFAAVVRRERFQHAHRIDAGQCGTQLPQRRAVGLRGVLGQAQPSSCPLVAEQQLPRGAVQHAQRDRRGVDDGPVERLAFQ